MTDKQSEMVAELREGAAETAEKLQCAIETTTEWRAADELERLRAALRLADHALDYYASTPAGRTDLAAHGSVKRALSHSATKETANE
jgi:hypothetical protein